MSKEKRNEKIRNAIKMAFKYVFYKHLTKDKLIKILIKEENGFNLTPSDIESIEIEFNKMLKEGQIKENEKKSVYINIGFPVKVAESDAYGVPTYSLMKL